MSLAVPFLAWRHPKPLGAQGRCIGARTDLPVDPRRLRRLARRIHREALRQGGPRLVCTSSLRRCRDVGRLLRRRWGWRHMVMPELLEADFGGWDGRAWADIPQAEVDAWVADFAGHAPGGGEPLRQVLARVAAWAPPAPGCVVVGHGGWMLARRWIGQHGPDRPPCSAAQWPHPPAYGACWPLR